MASCRALLIATCILLSGVDALKFTDSYEVSVVEVIAGDATFQPEIIQPPNPTVTVRCVDDDGSSINDTLTYTIVSGDLTLFSLDSSTGVFSVSSNHEFDYEQQTWYNVTIRCQLMFSDAGAVGEGTVNVYVISLNEYKPTIPGRILPIPVSEITPVGTIIATTTDDSAEGELRTYEAVDRDDGPGGQITFNFEASSHSDIFSFDNEKGRITLAKEFDVDNSNLGLILVSITITVCNEDIDFPTCENKLVAIYLTAANDQVPMFMVETNQISINETAPNGTVVVEVECVDLDVQHVVQDISFTEDVSDEIQSIFEVVYNDTTSSATIYLRTELDYDNITTYKLSLICSDGLHSDTIDIDINVLPINDNPPSFELEQYDFSVNRASPVPSDTLVGTVTATDDDRGVGNSLSYSLEDPSSKFSINSETGEITLRDYISAGDGNVFDFEVIANDGENEARTSVRVTAVGLLSILEWVYVGIGGVVLLIIIIIIGVIVFHHFIKAASIKTIVKEKIRERDDSELGSEQTDYHTPHPLFYPPPLLFPPHDGGMSMVGQPIDPGMEDDEETSEHSGTMGTIGSQYPGPGPILQEVVDYFHEGDKIIDKKGNKK